MQAIRQFYQDYPDILNHGQDHFAKAFGLGFLFVIKLDVIQFGDAIHNFSDFFTKFQGNLFFMGGSIFDNIVQNSSDKGFFIHAHFGKDFSHRNGVVDIGLSGHPGLPFMSLGSKQIGVVNFADLIFFQISIQHGTQITD